MKRNACIFTVVLLLGAVRLTAQDPQFTQFYAAPTYLNPAFAGTLDDNRFVMNYRHQWPAVSGAFVTHNASYDQYISGIKSGIGVLFTHDRAGTGALTRTNIAVQYAYEFQLNRKVSVRPAVQIGIGQRSLNFNRLTFGDQLLRNNAPGSIDPDIVQFADQNVLYPDFGTGALLYSDKFWFGLSAHHINRPNESLLQKDSRLPVRYSMHGGYRLRINERYYNKPTQHLVTAFNYRSQGDFDQLDVGVYYEYDPVTFGIWYRGLPGIKQSTSNYTNHDALALMLGIEIKKFYIGYSYDITISNLAVNTGGSHEISVMAKFAGKRRKKKTRQRLIPCAKF